MSTQHDLLSLHVGELIHCDVCMELDTSDYTELESREHSDRVDTAVEKIIALVSADERKRIREALEAQYDAVKEANTDLMGGYSLETAGVLEGLSAAIGLTEEQTS